MVYVIAMSLNHKANRILGGFVSPLTAKFVCSKEKGHHENTKSKKHENIEDSSQLANAVHVLFSDFVIS